ncbi:ArsR/SmtB family transcription factor [Aeromicrobium sp. CF3.5]|uniref:ArsR/SmtB family transcription factor n=1 Tax=Aeromicrobium sp. CF3.5 TaxID=3373078 RepID=UPI003EE534D9
MSFTSKQVEDLDTLKAVSHPIRMSLLAALRTHGPATASELGRRIEQSSGSTSYHLRQLERFGFVGDDTEQPSGRERRWRALQDSTRLPTSLAALPGGHIYLDAVRRRQQEYLLEGLNAWTENDPGLGHSDYLVRLEPDEIDQMMDEIGEVVSRYAGRSGPLTAAVHVLALPATRA